jgi:hypothetical protein
MIVTMLRCRGIHRHTADGIDGFRERFIMRMRMAAAAGVRLCAVIFMFDVRHHVISRGL